MREKRRRTLQSMTLRQDSALPQNDSIEVAHDVFQVESPSSTNPGLSSIVVQ